MYFAHKGKISIIHDIINNKEINECSNSLKDPQTQALPLLFYMHGGEDTFALKMYSASRTLLQT
jgi:hypothetical protein